MDPRPVVTGAAPSPEPVLAERAIFTSIRSPMGRGYRIVASSPGISPEEKREIVQRAPSHQSICDPSSQGCGLASFMLESGRRCIFSAQNAGVEHSARGDYRVHTHVLVLAPAGYRRLRCDPFAIVSAARAALAHEWLNDQPPQVLTQLALPVNTGEGSGSAAAPPSTVDGVDRALNLLSCLLRGHRVFVHGAQDLQGALAQVWAGVPAAVRDTLSLSCGLRFSPGRSFRLVMTQGPCGEPERSGIGAEYTVVEWSKAARPEASEFDPWLNFVRERWAAGALAELHRISTELTKASTAPALARVAALHDDLALLAEADLTHIDELTARHVGGDWAEGAGAPLYTEFCRIAVLRRQQLQQQQAVEANESPADAGVQSD